MKEVDNFQTSENPHSDEKGSKFGWMKLPAWKRVIGVGKIDLEGDKDLERGHWGVVQKYWCKKRQFREEWFTCSV